MEANDSNRDFVDVMGFQLQVNEVYSQIDKLRQNNDFYQLWLNPRAF
jgi:hypothetical protein